MLVLTRRENESVVLTISPVEGTDLSSAQPITIELVDIKGNQARIGITAPDNVNVVRSELLLVE